MNAPLEWTWLSEVCCEIVCWSPFRCHPLPAKECLNEGRMNGMQRSHVPEIYFRVTNTYVIVTFYTPLGHNWIVWIVSMFYYSVYCQKLDPATHLFLHQCSHWKTVDLQDPVTNMDGIPNFRADMHSSDPERNTAHSHVSLEHQYQNELWLHIGLVCQRRAGSVDQSAVSTWTIQRWVCPSVHNI